MKAGVFESSGARGVCDRTVHRAYGQDITDASSQLPAPVKRGESAARFGEMIGGRIEWNVAPLERRENGIVGQTKQQPALLWGEFRAGEIARDHGSRTKSR